MRRVARLMASAGVAAACAAGGGAVAAPEVTPVQVASLLASLHPDYTRYIASVRYGATRLRPATLYAGLVRRGGLDPRVAEDGPITGRGVSNDLVVYADTFEPWRTPAWRLLVADHEYFHARHLAKGFAIPLVGFSHARADADYREALAWGYALQRAVQGVYGDLAATERAEAASRYRAHYEGFRDFVMRRQASAWAHYGRFLPDPASILTRDASAPTEALSPRAAAGTR